MQFVTMSGFLLFAFPFIMFSGHLLLLRINAQLPSSNLLSLEKSIYNRKVLFVCVSRKMITLPNGLKSSSLAVAISFSKHCNKKMFSLNFLEMYF